MPRSYVKPGPRLLDGLPGQARVCDGDGPLRGEAAVLRARRHDRIQHQRAVVPNQVVEPDVPELLRDDDRVLVDGAVGAVVHLIALVVVGAEEPIVGEEVLMLERYGAFARVLGVLDLFRAADVRDPAFAGGVLDRELAQAGSPEGRHPLLARSEALPGPHDG